MNAAAAEGTAFQDLVARTCAGEARALGRLISLVEDDPLVMPEVLARIHERLGRAIVVGFTGTPGVGKSSLINAYVHELRKRSRTVGVLAIDPSSPVTGGAVLGDRIRMSDHVADPEVFVRSLASRGHLGGISRATAMVVDLMDAAGKDVIVVETVGTGQSDVDVARLADITVLLMAAGSGDSVQFDKAGILELADLYAVTRCDLSGAEQVAAQLQNSLGLSERNGGRDVIRTSASNGQGVHQLADRIEALTSSLEPARRGPSLRVRQLIAAIASDWVRCRVETIEDARLDALCERVSRGETGHEEAARELLAIV